MRSYNYPYSLSLANGASGASYGSNSSQTSHHYYSGSGHQLRSTFSQPASASYVTRSHLPFVSQSMLVAHCYTTSGQLATSHQSSGPSRSYPSGGGGGYSSLHPRAASLGLNLASSSARPSSIKRPQVPSHHHYHNTSTSSGLVSARSSYLAPAASSRYLSPSSASSYSSSRPAAGSFRSSYRPSYQPIRLRERPLLAQLRASTSSEPARAHSRSSYATRQAAPIEPAVDRETSAAAAATTTTTTDAETSEKAAARDDDETEEARQERAKSEEITWQADVGRNISRNKYIIKFRERDDRQQQPVVASDIKLDSDKQAEPGNGQEPVTSGETTTMRIKVIEPEPEPEPEPVTLIEAPSSKEQPKLLDEDVSNQAQVAASGANKKKPPKERRNIKLKIKSVNVSSQQQGQANEVCVERQTLAAAAPSDTAETPDQLSSPVQQPSDSDASPQGQPAKATRAKRLVPKAASKTAKATSPVSVSASETDLSSASKTPESPDTKPATRLVKKKPASSKSGQSDSAGATPEAKKLARPTRRKASTTVDTTTTTTSCQEPVATEQAEAADISEDQQQQQQQRPVVVPSVAVANKRVRFRNYYIDDFDFVSVLGHGGWGFVILAELKGHDICFAVKCIKKITIIEDDDFESIMIERKVLALGNINPFICKLFCTFETNGYLFFVMEFCAGGDLMFHVQKEGKFSESRCRFYAAEIICAIRFLHNKHIIYRDLKLDNILLDSGGHIRLVDFGMCQCRTYREEMLPSNFCGTPEYISPEIIKGVPYNHSVDWWSFGVLLYEMAVGKMPFRGDDENELLWNVCYENIHYPMFLSKQLTSLLQLLLEREPTKRMGMASCKAGDIYDQAWFAAVDWPAMEAMQVKPPFVPQVESRSDVQNFDTDFTESRPELSPVDEATLQRIDQSLFLKFPYTNPEIDIFAS